MRKLSHLFPLITVIVFVHTVVFGQVPTSTTTAAGKLLVRGDLKGALVILDDAVARKVDLLEALKMRSAVRSMSSDLQGSVDDLSRAIEIKSDDPALYEQRAMMRLRLGQDQALILKDLDSAIAYGMKLDRVYSLRATVHRNLGDIAAAIKDYESAIGLRPDHAGAHVGLASIYLQSGETNKAIEILENFLSTYDSSMNNAPNGAGKAVVGTISSDKSRGGYEKIPVETVVVAEGLPVITGKRFDPEKRTQLMEDARNLGLAYTNLASAYLQRGEGERALVTVEKAIKKDGSDFYAFQTRGRIRVDLGFYNDAISDLTLSIKIFPGNPACYLERGIAYLMTDRISESKSDFDKYLQLFPGGKETLDRRIQAAKTLPPK